MFSGSVPGAHYGLTLPNMLTVTHDELPDSHLLVVASTAAAAADSKALLGALHQALCCNKCSVWVDCSLIDPADLSAAACRLLCVYYHALAMQGRSLVIAHASKEMQECLAATGDQHPKPVASLVDAPRPVGALPLPGIVSAAAEASSAARFAVGRESHTSHPPTAAVGGARRAYASPHGETYPFGLLKAD